MTAEIIGSVAIILSIYLITVGVTAYLDKTPESTETTSPSPFITIVKYLRLLDHPFAKFVVGVVGVVIFLYFVVLPIIIKQSRSGGDLGKSFKHFEFI